MGEARGDQCEACNITIDPNGSGTLALGSSDNTAVTIDAISFSIDATGGASNITLTSDGAGDDLTIALAGATDSSLILSSTGTGAAYSITTDKFYLPAFSLYSVTAGVSPNFGNGYFSTTAIGSPVSYGEGLWKYTPPTGYRAMCTKYR